MNDPLAVDYQDVVEALPRVHAALQPTGLHYWPGVSKQLGCELFLKHENHQPVGAFKVRGGVNLVESLDASEREAGLLAVSTGNHGQSLAFACRRRGVPCTIVVPCGANPGKVRAIEQWGARLIHHGRDFDEAREHAEQLSRPGGPRYVHSANEPLLIAGVGTMACEILDELPAPDVILVPIGLGSGVCGTCVVVKHRHPKTLVIGVQAAGASAVTQSWRRGERVCTERADTWAEGLATRVPAEMTLQIMSRLMDEALLVSDAELRSEVGVLLRETRNLAEGAGAAALAAVRRNRERFAGQTVVAVLSGGNLDPADMARAAKW